MRTPAASTGNAVSASTVTSTFLKAGVWAGDERLRQPAAPLQFAGREGA
jgi:hypothetical protein